MANSIAGLRSVDLNLLPILQALLSEGNVTRAAAKLGLSQPATSQALTRLRHLLDDPLLIRIGRTMRLTPRAELLRPELDRVCSSVSGVLLKAEFRPEQTKREFMVSSSDFMALMLGPALMQTFSELAPGVSVRFIDVPIDLHDRIASGEIDLSVFIRVESLAEGLCMRSGYMDELVGVAAPDHPLAISPPKSVSDYEAHSQLGIHSYLPPVPGSWKLRRELVGHHRSVTLTASNTLVLPLLAARSKAFAVIPRKLAELAAQMSPLAIFELPEEARMRFENCLLWSPLYEADPAHAWFRGVLDQAMQLHYTREDSEPTRISRGRKH